jgi:hypothetical protein
MTATKRSPTAKAAPWFTLAVTIAITEVLILWYFWPNQALVRPSSAPVDVAQPQEEGVLARKEAIAFLLGWHSKIVLARNVAQRELEFALMKVCMDELGVRLSHPVEYYLNDAWEDGGARAQMFTDETFKQLKGSIANHFGVASNLVLALSRQTLGDTSEDTSIDLEELVTLLDIPAGLKEIPDTGRVEWVDRIKGYFESLLIADPVVPLAEANL